MDSLMPMDLKIKIQKEILKVIPIEIRMETQRRWDLMTVIQKRLDLMMETQRRWDLMTAILRAIVMDFRSLTVICLEIQTKTLMETPMVTLMHLVISWVIQINFLKKIPMDFLMHLVTGWVILTHWVTGWVILMHLVTGWVILRGIVMDFRLLMVKYLEIQTEILMENSMDFQIKTEMVILIMIQMKHW